MSEGQERSTNRSTFSWQRFRATGGEDAVGVWILAAVIAAACTFTIQTVSLDQLMSSFGRTHSWYDLLNNMGPWGACAVPEDYVRFGKWWLLASGVAQTVFGVILGRTSLLLPRTLSKKFGKSLKPMAAAFAFAGIAFAVSGVFVILLSYSVDGDYERFVDEVPDDMRHEIGYHYHYDTSPGVDRFHDARYVAEGLGFTLFGLGAVFFAVSIWRAYGVSKLVPLASLIAGTPMFLVWPVVLREITADLYGLELLCSYSPLDLLSETRSSPTSWTTQWTSELFTIAYHVAGLCLFLWLSLVAILLLTGWLRRQSSPNST